MQNTILLEINQSQTFVVLKSAKKQKLMKSADSACVGFLQ